MNTIVSVTMCCDACYTTMPTKRTTSRGARGDAERAGWKVSYQADHRAGASNAPERRDECPRCRPDKPRDLMAAWIGGGE